MSRTRCSRDRCDDRAACLGLPGALAAQAASAAAISPTDESKVPRYFGPYQNWANSPQVLSNAVVTLSLDVPAPVSCVKVLTQRAYVTDCATPPGALCPVFVVLSNAQLTAGTLHNFRMWNRGSLGGRSPPASAGNPVQVYLLRSTGVAVRANDVIGFYGEGTVNTATSRVVVTTSGSPAAAGTTVVVTATVTAVRPGSNLRAGTVPLRAVTGPMRAPPVAVNTSSQAALALSHPGTAHIRFPPCTQGRQLQPQHQPEYQSSDPVSAGRPSTGVPPQRWSGRS